MKEYCIFNIWNGGTPFISHIYKSFEEAYHDLLNFIELEKERNRAYYVMNDFYKNVYPPFMKKCKVFQIKEREVGEWTDYKEEYKKENTNIIYLSKFIDKHN